LSEIVTSSRNGDQLETARLTELLYSELRDIAAGYLRFENEGHTLQPTALVHEAYLRLTSQKMDWQNRAHFLGIAAQTMRRVLMDHARKRAAAKRGSAISITGESSGDADQVLDLIALDDALHRLADKDARTARIVELRYFGGLDVDETAEVMRVSPATVKREWTFAKAWLGRELAENPA
jgi:RNA polymerase sigma factor (TIGR02999 family)